MRLASAEVKRLLARGQRLNTAEQGYSLASRVLAKRQSELQWAAGVLHTSNHAVEVTAGVTAETPEGVVCTLAAASGIALSIPKKQLKRAVDRNRVKRILRETFRHHPIRASGLALLVTLNSRPAAAKELPLLRLERRARAASIRRAAQNLFTKLVAHSGGR